MAHLVADNLILLLVVQRRYRETPFVVRVDIVVNLSKVRIVLMQRIRSSVITGDLLVGFHEAPS